MALTPANLFNEARQMFGGADNSPDITDDTLLGFLNEWVRNVLAKQVKLGAVAVNKTFTGSPATPPIDTDYTMPMLTSEVNKIISVWWKPTAGTKVQLGKASEQSLAALGYDLALDQGVPQFYYMDWGTCTGQTNPQDLVKLYPIPNAGGTCYLYGEGVPTIATLTGVIPFPDEFFEAARFYVIYKARCFREDYSDQDRLLMLKQHDEALINGLRQYNLIAHQPSIRQRLHQAGAK